jgi:hypothetical protein
VEQYNRRWGAATAKQWGRCAAGAADDDNKDKKDHDLLAHEEEDRCWGAASVWGRCDAGVTHE